MYTPRAASPLAQCLRCSVPWVGSSTRKWSGTSAGSPVGKGYMWYDTPPLAGLPLRYRKYLWSNQLLQSKSVIAFYCHDPDRQNFVFSIS